MNTETARSDEQSEPGGEPDVERRAHLHQMWSAVAASWGEHADYSDMRHSGEAELMLDSVALAPLYGEHRNDCASLEHGALSGAMGITAKQRASFALRGSSGLEADKILGIIESASNAAKGGGKSLLTTGITNLGAQVNIHRRTTNRIDMSLTSGKKLVELGTLSAEAKANGNGRSTVRVGGLDTYKTQQSKLLYLIPVGPKQIYGMDLYKRFLKVISDEITAADPSAQLTLAQAQ